MSANKDVIRRLVDEVWANRNLAAADELVAAGYVGHDPTLGEPAHGPQGFKDAAAVYQTAFPDASIAIEELVAEGDRVVARWTGRGTHQGELMGIAPTGKQITVSGITVSRLEGGKVVEEWTVYDALGMLMQLGAVPQPTPA